MNKPNELQMESIKAYMDAGALVVALKEMRALHTNIKDIAADNSYQDAERAEATKLSDLSFYDFVGAIMKLGGNNYENRH